MPTPTLRSQPPPGPRPTTTFITREVEIPDSPEGSPVDASGSHFPGPGPPGSAHSRPSTGGRPGGSSSLSGSSGGGGGALPALPYALMDALAREPPAARGSPGSSSHHSTNSSNASAGRTSLSFSRPSASPQPPPADSPSSIRSPALPAIAPHSPLHLSYHNGSPAASPNPNRAQSASPAAGARRVPRHKASLGPDDFDRAVSGRPSSASSSSHRVQSDSEVAGADTALGDGYVGDYASPSLPSEAERSGSGTKRSLWKNVAFGRSRADPEPPLPSWTPPPAIYSRNAPPHLGGGLSPSPQLSATPPPLLRTKSSSPNVSRSSSTTRLRSPTTTKAGATKWLMDAAAPPVGLGLEDDLEPAAPRRRNGKAPQGSDDEDEEEDGSSPWSAGRGQQYTHDLTKGLRSTYDSDVDAEPDRGGESDLDGAPEEDDDADEELLTTVIAGSIPQPDHSRRKPGAPLRIATDARHDETGGGMQTAPMIGSVRPGEGPDSLRNRSWSDGDVALAGRETDSDLAKGMGLPGPPPVGSSTQLQSTGVSHYLLDFGQRGFGR